MKKNQMVIVENIRKEMFAEYSKCQTFEEKNEFICNKLISLQKSNMSEEDMNLHVYALIGAKLPIFYTAFCRLYAGGVIEVRVENEGMEGDNRKNDNFSFAQKVDTLGGYCAEAERVVKYDLLNNPMYMGNMTDLKVKVYVENGKVVISIAEGGHRAYLGREILQGTERMKEYKNARRPLTANEKRYNKYFANTYYSEKNSEARKVLDSIVLSLNFVDRDFDPAHINRNKNYTSSNDTNFTNKSTDFYKIVKEYMLLENNGYENTSISNIEFLDDKKEYAQKIDACIYVLGRLLNVNAGKYNLIHILCQYVTEKDIINNICKLLPVFYYELYSRETIRSMVTQWGKGNNYSTAAMAALIRACTYVSIEKGYFKKAYGVDYIEFSEGHAQYLLDNPGSKKTACDYAKFLMNKKDYDTMDIKFRLALARGTINYMLENVDYIEKNKDNIVLTMKECNRTDHTGDKDAGMSAAFCIAEGLISGNWEV